MKKNIVIINNEHCVEIENRIYAEIARSLWGNDYYYNIRLNNDNQFQEAINNLDEARAILD